MRTIRYLSTACVTIAFVIGCGEKTPPESTPADSSAASDENAGFRPQRPTHRYDDPRQAVHDFLVAVKTGEESTATALLTTAAQKEAWSNGMAISSEGFPDAAFEVSEVNYLEGKTEAEVWSTWADKTPYGEEKSFECVWLLREEPHGWCIFGMAAKFLEGVPPVVLPFEDQAEMAKRQQWADQKIREQRQLERHQQQALAQDSFPQTQVPTNAAAVQHQKNEASLAGPEAPPERQAMRPSTTVR